MHLEIGQDYTCLARVISQSYDRKVLVPGRFTLPIVLFATAACSSSGDDNRVSTIIPSVTHAVVELQRSKSTNAAVSDQANVLVSVLRVPATLDSRNIVRLVGLSPTYPGPGQCERVDYALSATEATASVQHVEMLDVGDVTLIAGTRVSPLARQAFPTVTDFIAGVVYTTRDLSSDPLPPSLSYTIVARGAPTIPAFRIEVPAPHEPANIMIEGVNLAQVARLTRGLSVELTWTPGDQGDKFLVEIKSPDRPNDVTCAYDDTAGKGRLPSDVLISHGTVRLEIHRLRTTSATIRGLDRSQVEFDYSLDHLLELVD